MDETTGRGAGRPNSSSRRTLLIGAAAAAGGAALIARLWDLQIVRSGEYIGQAEANRTRQQAVSPVRGVVYDRNGVQLVRNLPIFDVWVMPGDVPEELLPDVATRLGELTGNDGPELATAIGLGQGRPLDPIRLIRNVTRETALIIKERTLDLPGITVRDSAKREYFHGEVMGQMVGFTGPISPERTEEYLERGVGLDEDVGLSGIENHLQDLLRGRDGRRLIEVGALGEERREFAYTPPESGRSVYLTVEVEFQRGMHEIMARFLGDLGAGVAIVMNIDSGDVLGMVSYPAFNNQLFAEGISTEDFSRLASDSRRPLINHAIAGLYPPGSTYKLVVAAGALEEKVLSPEHIVDCPGHLTLPSGWIFYDWLLTGHGEVNIHRAISESCNVYFYNVSGGNPYTDLVGLGERRLAEYSRAFGFGRATGIDLPNELDGIVPDSEWKHDNLDEPWVTGDTYQAAIGQGFVQATPLQLLNMYAAIGNGGTLYRPRLIDRVENSQREVIDIPEVEELGRLPLSADNLERLRSGLLEAVQGVNGTGKQARSEVASVAGKTGTAEYTGQLVEGGNLPSHAWFAGYAPADRPRIAFIVLIRDGGEGSAAAALVARDIVDFYFTGTVAPMRYAPFSSRRGIG